MANTGSAGVGPEPMPSRGATFVRRIPTAVWFVAAVLLALAVWAHWTTLKAMARQWISDPAYSHGVLAPAFALVLLWLTLDRAESIRWSFDWRGLVFLALSFLVRCGNLATWNLDWLDGAAFVIAVGGIFALIGGSRALEWAWPALAFLMLTIPLPYRLERMLGGPLQGLATDASTFLLQLLGLPAAAEGHTIILGDLHIGVAEACSGLSMLMIFIALAVGFAAVIRRPLLDRAILVASAVPIALAVNILRITATGVLHVRVGARIADLVFHDLAGWLMMPVALGLLWLEIKFLSYVLIDEPPESQ